MLWVDKHVDAKQSSGSCHIAFVSVSQCVFCCFRTGFSDHACNLKGSSMEPWCCGSMCGTHVLGSLLLLWTVDVCSILYPLNPT